MKEEQHRALGNAEGEHEKYSRSEDLGLNLDDVIRAQQTVLLAET
jgi:hypothetical protein